MFLIWNTNYKPAWLYLSSCGVPFVYCQNIHVQLTNVFFHWCWSIYTWLHSDCVLKYPFTWAFRSLDQDRKGFYVIARGYQNTSTNYCTSESVTSLNSTSGHPSNFCSTLPIISDVHKENSKIKSSDLIAFQLIPTISRWLNKTFGRDRYSTFTMI